MRIGAGGDEQITLVTDHESTCKSSVPMARSSSRAGDPRRAALRRGVPRSQADDPAGPRGSFGTLAQRSVLDPDSWEYLRSAVRIGE